MGQATEELTGVYRSTRFLSEDKTFVIGGLEDKTTVKGNCEPGGLVPGCKYRFMGRWKDDPKWGKQFEFSAYVQHDPHSRHGVVEYLERFAPYIGEQRAHRLVDLYGADRAISVLKTNPRQVAIDLKGLSLERAEEASEVLRSIEKFQETRVKLLDLFAGRGFPQALYEECIKKFGVKAPERIKHDPWCLVVRKMPGCGFARVDRLYLELGHPVDRMKRQVMAFWHTLHSDMSGSVWFRKEEIVQDVGGMITGNYRPERAIRIGIRSGFLATREIGGETWIAEAEESRSEVDIAERLAVLCVD